MGHGRTVVQYMKEDGHEDVHRYGVLDLRRGRKLMADTHSESIFRSLIVSEYRGQVFKYVHILETLLAYSKKNKRKKEKKKKRKKQ